MQPAPSVSAVSSAASEASSSSATRRVNQENRSTVPENRKNGNAFLHKTDQNLQRDLDRIKKLECLYLSAKVQQLNSVQLEFQSREAE